MRPARSFSFFPLLFLLLVFPSFLWRCSMCALLSWPVRGRGRGLVWTLIWLSENVVEAGLRARSRVEAARDIFTEQAQRTDGWESRKTEGARARNMGYLDWFIDWEGNLEDIWAQSGIAETSIGL